MVLVRRINFHILVVKGLSRKVVGFTDRQLCMFNYYPKHPVEWLIWHCDGIIQN